MKKSALIMAFALVFAATEVALAQTTPPQDKPRPEVTRRQINQQKRINQGVKIGELTPHETRKLERQQGRIQTKKEVDKTRNGGTLTARNKAQLNRMENRSSRNIYRKKHNLRTRG